MAEGTLGRVTLVLFLFLSSLATAMAGPNLAGRVLDRAALKQVRTFCIDTSNLTRGPVRGSDFPHPEAFDVREVIKRESKPDGLLSKLPWKLEANCSVPGVDAVVRIAFIEGLGISYIWRARLQVLDKTSSRVIYSVDGNPLGIQGGPPAVSQEDYDHALRQSAADNALAAMVSDVNALPKNP